eukprot:scaffold42880_cov79-Cyclotella_meneghiniana.AAC.1
MTAHSSSLSVTDNSTNHRTNASGSATVYEPSIVCIENTMLFLVISSRFNQAQSSTDTRSYRPSLLHAFHIPSHISNEIAATIHLYHWITCCNPVEISLDCKHRSLYSIPFQSLTSESSILPAQNRPITRTCLRVSFTSSVRQLYMVRIDPMAKPWLFNSNPFIGYTTVLFVESLSDHSANRPHTLA